MALKMRRNEKRAGTSCGTYGWEQNSPLFGKDKMATFERYFLEDEGKP